MWNWGCGYYEDCKAHECLSEVSGNVYGSIRDGCGIGKVDSVKNAKFKSV